MSVGEALAVSATPGANHLAVTERGGAPKETRGLIRPAGAEDQKLVTQAAIAVEPTWVVGKERFDEVVGVHIQVIGPNRLRVKRSARRRGVVPDDPGRAKQDS